jgi:DNA-binding MarR family transcriptional regulator
MRTPPHDGGIDLPVSIGYALKQASAALRTAMEESLDPLGIGMAQYNLLEQLRHAPALTSSDLARGAFVTRQSMHAVLHDLERRGLVARTGAGSGRARPVALTDDGRELADRASTAVAGVEDRMLAGLGSAQRTELLRALVGVTAALGAGRASRASSSRTMSGTSTRST